ncbi:MAG TPA: L-histidine N(alpha)-methyltransferase, partial [Candidatus Dormibacteraeota bacterium]|nr:L-histidine N(alpha)-methyltransferase [Candidatus Dormibacteraeota bacterium]
PLDLLELGSGSSLKTRVLIEATLERHGSTRYTAIDISVDAIRGAAAGLLERYPQLSMRALAGDYFQVLPNLRSLDAAASSHRTLALFLGSNIGNYRDKRACQLLGSLHDALRTGDLFLLGVDLRKDRATMERAYNDPTGITAAFSKNLLARVVRELGSSIDVGNFEHEARYDERTCSIESFLVARSSAEYSLGEGRPLVTFDADERIHIESSRKFQLDELSELAAACGFTEIQTLLDERERYAVVLWERL